jgi:hypothetical protein
MEKKYAHISWKVDLDKNTLDKALSSEMKKLNGFLEKAEIKRCWVEYGPGTQLHVVFGYPGSFDPSYFWSIEEFMEYANQHHLEGANAELLDRLYGDLRADCCKMYFCFAPSYWYLLRIDHYIEMVFNQKNSRNEPMLMPFLSWEWEKVGGFENAHDYAHLWWSWPIQKPYQKSREEEDVELTMREFIPFFHEHGLLTCEVYYNLPSDSNGEKDRVEIHLGLGGVSLFVTPFWLFEVGEVAKKIGLVDFQAEALSSPYQNVSSTDGNTFIQVSNDEWAFL